MHFHRPISLFLFLSAFCFASAFANEIEFRSTELAPRLHMINGVGGFAGGNMLLATGDDGIVLIDDSIPDLLDKLNKQIASVTGKPIDFLINTHVHDDHTGNNAHFGSGQTIIVGHQNLRLAMKAKDKPKSTLPVVTYSTKMSFHLNGYEFKLEHLPSAHTDADTYITVPEVNIIHAGDALFNGMFPYIDLESGGSLNGYIRAQQLIFNRANKDTKIIPGHGPLASKKDIKASINMLLEAKNLVQVLVDKGMSEEAVIKANPLKKFHKDWNWGFITTEKMTRTIFLSLTDSMKTSINGHKHDHKDKHDHKHD